jgi:hypothetical protein
MDEWMMCIASHQALHVRSKSQPRSWRSVPFSPDEKIIHLTPHLKRLRPAAAAAATHGVYNIQSTIKKHHPASKTTAHRQLSCH